METGKLIYLLEDEPDIRYLLQLVLVRNLYNVSTFDTVAAFKARPPGVTPDLYIFDVSLPDGNGLEVAKSLLLANAVCPPVMLISAEPHYKYDALAIGAKLFMPKPFNIMELLNAVKMLLTSPD